MKREADKDRQIKRIGLPAQVKLLAQLQIPIQMVDPGVYIEVSKKSLLEALAVAKQNRFTALADSIEKAIAKCDKMIQKGPEEYVKKRKEKDLNDYDVVELLKQPDCLKELESMDLQKIKNPTIRDKLSSFLAKRPAPAKSTEKDSWENDYFAYYKAKHIKKD